MRTRTVCLALCAGLILSACSGGTETASSQSSTLSEVVSVASQGQAQPAGSADLDAPLAGRSDGRLA